MVTDSPWRAVSRNVAWIVGDRVVRTATSVFIGLWVARYLGPSAYGELGFAAATVTIFGAFTGLGLEAILVRDLATRPSASHCLVGTALGMRIVAGSVASALSIALVFITSPNNVERSLVFVLAVTPVLQSADVFDLWFQSELRSRSTVVAKAWALLVISAARIAAILLHLNVLAFGVLLLCETAAGTVALSVAYLRSPGAHTKLTTSLSEARRLLAESWPYLLSSVAIVVYTRIDQVMLGSMLNSEAVGTYTAATRLTEFLYFLPMAIMSSVAPVLAKLKQSDEELFKATLQRILTELFRLCVVVCAVVALLSPVIVRVLYGARFASAAVVLALHIWTFAFVSLGVVSSLWLVNFGLQHVALLRSVVAAFVNIAMNLVLIPRYGGAGAAAATLTAQIVATYASNAISPRTRPLFRQQTKAMAHSLALWRGLPIGRFWTILR